MEAIQSPEAPYQKINDNFLTQIPKPIEIQPDLEQIKSDINDALSKVEQVKINNYDHILKYVTLVIGSISFIFVTLKMLYLVTIKRYVSFALMGPQVTKESRCSKM